MSQIKLFVKNIFEFNQRDFWIILISNILLGVFFRYFEVHEFIQAGTVLFLLMKSFSFYKATSVMPSISSDFDRFSWKYLQGLPLSKKELIVALVLSNLIAVAPLFIWILSFAPQLGNLFLNEGEEVPFSIKMKLLLVSLPALLFIGLFSLQNLVKLPRQQYSKIHSKIAFYQMVKTLSVLAFVLIYGTTALIVFTEWSGLPLGRYIGKGIKFTFEILSSWWIVPISILVVFRAYYSTLKVIQDESIGYIKQTWNTKRDVSIIAVCAVLNFGILNHLDWGVPAEYQGNTMTKSVFNKDIKAIEKALQKGKNLNQATPYGFTPIMVAANEGNYPILKLLLDKGADLKGNAKFHKQKLFNGSNIFSLAVKGGEIKIIKELIDRGLDVNHVTTDYGNSPLHIASNRCNSKVVDLLIENKAYLNAVNKHNETALHWASTAGCFANVVSLIEAGVDPMIKSKKGKLAKDYVVSKYPKDLDYYLEKRSRQPAGK